MVLGDVRYVRLFKTDLIKILLKLKDFFFGGQWLVWLQARGGRMNDLHYFDIQARPMSKGLNSLCCRLADPTDVTIHSIVGMPTF